MKSFKIFICMLLTPPFILCSIVIANSLQKFDWGSVPDWFSFFANFCTVIITFMIAIRAKKFLDEKVHSEGLTRGYKILDSIDEIVDSLPSLMSRTISNDEVIQMASKPDENYENYSLESAISNADKIYWKINEIQIKIKQVEFMIKRLNRWHVDINHTHEFNLFIKTCSVFLENLGYITGHNSELHYPNTEYSTKKARQLTPLLSVMLVEVENCYEQILSLKFKETFTVN
ncbi:TPA: hypothetical protein RQO69_003033 [Klebsiella oxytoca]|nr:hypothetical protein [Klebsiella oxytoca]